MFKRDILDQLNDWKNRADRKPLILRGARQVGKTSIVRMFGEGYDEYLEFNLDKEEERELFSHRISAAELVQLLLISRDKTGTGSVLLFIDEIQNSANAIGMLRYLYEECPHIHVISAGSILEIIMEKEDIGFPVGRVEHLNMYPLTFREYLVATGRDRLLEEWHSFPLPESLHRAMLKSFHTYVLIGGMPEIVANYAEHRDVPSLNHIYNALLTTYRDDVTRYAAGASTGAVLRHCLETAPFEAGKRIKYAGFGQSRYSSREVGEALKILEQAMVLELIHPSTSLSIPIVPDFRKSPKLQFLDTGLINYFVGLQEHFFTHDDLHAIHKGLLAEHIVMQEVIALRKNRLKKQCFWVRQKGPSNAEVDLLLQSGSNLVPVEVKAGPTGRLRSLHSFIDLSHCDRAVRISSAPFSVEKAVTIAGNDYTLINVPPYHCGMIDRIIAENSFS